MKYKDEIIRTMKWLAEDQRTVFLGQSVKWPGTGLYWTLKDIPNEKKIELPVLEDIQMGMSIGMSLKGMIPISIYPRMDFLILALNQLVNHLDKFEEMSDGQFKPGVIIRTAEGSVKPLFPGPQHNGNYYDSLSLMLKNVELIELKNKKDIFPSYQRAFREEGKSFVLVEYPDLYET